jgi:hypothetical protein
LTSAACARDGAALSANTASPHKPVKTLQCLVFISFLLS